MARRLKHYKKDNTWIRDHFEELVEKYGGFFVAVAKQKVTGVGHTPYEAEKKSIQKYPHVLPSVIQIPKAKDIHANC